MANEIARLEIYNRLRSQNVHKKIEAVRLLTRLGVDEALHVIEGILNVDGNLGMKLEALRILPELVSAENYTEVSRLLQIGLENDDPEIVRNGLLSIRKILPTLTSKPLITSVVKLLYSEDTDLQYEAILGLSHLCSQTSPEEFRFHIQPLTSYPDMFVKSKASEVLGRTGTFENREEK